MESTRACGRTDWATSSSIRKFALYVANDVMLSQGVRRIWKRMLLSTTWPPPAAATCVSARAIVPPELTSRCAERAPYLHHAPPRGPFRKLGRQVILGGSSHAHALLETRQLLLTLMPLQRCSACFRSPALTRHPLRCPSSSTASTKSVSAAAARRLSAAPHTRCILPPHRLGAVCAV